MKTEFIPYKQALKLKKLGFNEPCFGKYDINGELYYYYDHQNSNIQNYVIACSAPLYQQAFKWFREKYNLHGCVDLHVSNPTHWYIRIDNIVENDYLYHSEDENLQFKTYEEAEIACLNKLIEIFKNK